MATNKTITMHPLNTAGDAIDPTVNLYPKTLATNVLDADGVTPYNFQKAIVVNDINGYLEKQGDAVLTFNVNPLMKRIIETLHPIGSLFCCYEDVSNPNAALDPGNVYGLNMQWERIEGRFLMAAGTTSGTDKTYAIQTSGGFADLILPSHRHSVSKIEDECTELNGSHTHSVSLTCTAHDTSKDNCARSANRDQGGKITYTVTTASAGSHYHKFDIPAHNTIYEGVDESLTNRNLPPYITIKVWRRTA